MKRCTKCGSDGPFNKKADSADGLQPWCKTCCYAACIKSRAAGQTVASQGRAVRKRRNGQREKVNQYKLDHGCADCGYRANAVALQFDHVRGRKEFDIAHAIGVGWARLAAEIEKCDVVCANCHAIRTYERGHYGRYSKTTPPELVAFVVETHQLVRSILSGLSLSDDQQGRSTAVVKRELFVTATAAKAILTSDVVG